MVRARKYPVREQIVTRFFGQRASSRKDPTGIRGQVRFAVESLERTAVRCRIRVTGVQVAAGQGYSEQEDKYESPTVHDLDFTLRLMKGFVTAFPNSQSLISGRDRSAGSGMIASAASRKVFNFTVETSPSRPDDSRTRSVLFSTGKSV